MMLIVHGVYHNVPLFLASFAGFSVAITGYRAHSQDARVGAA
jgi:hypothetical protein